MSTISPAANRVLAILAAVVAGWTLRLPFYAPPGTDPTATDGPVEQLAWHVARVFQDVGGTRTGEAAMPGGAGLMLVLLGVTALLAGILLLTATPLVGDGLRLAGLLPLLVIVVAAVHRPAGLTVHFGLLAAAAACLLLASAAWQAGAVRAQPATVFR